MSRDTKDVYGAYVAQQRQTETVRQTDAHALLSCASKLEAARRPDATKQDYYDAIRHNLQLWTIFQVCVSEPASELPRDIKLLILRISKFVDKRSMEAMTKYEPSFLEPLISINRQIAAGLSQGGAVENGAQQPVVVPPPVAPPFPPLPSGMTSSATYQPSPYQRGSQTPYGHLPRVMPAAPLPDQKDDDDKPTPFFPTSI